MSMYLGVGSSPINCRKAVGEQCSTDSLFYPGHTTYVKDASDGLAGGVLNQISIAITRTF